MNTGTVSIPNRWQEGSYQIKSFIESYARNLGQSIEVAIGGETDSGQIWVTDPGTLTHEQREAVDNAVYNLNNYLNRPKGEPWKARNDAEKELESQLAKIDNIFCKPKL